MGDGRDWAGRDQGRAPGGFQKRFLELPEEFLDQLSQGFVEKAYVDPNKPTDEIFNDAAMAGLQGFTLGALTAGTAHGVHAAGTGAVRLAEGALEKSRMRREHLGRIARIVQERRLKMPYVSAKQQAKFEICLHHRRRRGASARRAGS